MTSVGPMADRDEGDEASVSVVKQSKVGVLQLNKREKRSGRERERLT